MHAEPKIIERCALPLTEKRVAPRIIKDLAVIDITPTGLFCEVAPGCLVGEAFWQKRC
jgi:3-oxoacid CoA-transferase subunit B